MDALRADPAPLLPHTAPLAAQRAAAGWAHDTDVTHIVAAEGEFASLFPAHEADTLVWLQLPGAAARKMTCTGAAFPTHWLLPYRSATLRASGFARFGELLDDARYQRRKTSALLLSGHLGSTAAAAAERMRGIRYVLDLGPSADDDLRSAHLEALTLPRGIVQYSAMTGTRVHQRVPVHAAGGHDDACRCFRQRLFQGGGGGGGGGHDSSAAPSEAAAVEEDGKPGALPDSIWDLPLAPELALDDYCEIRHAANVIRLLLAMAGSSPGRRPLLLDSAARVYTIAGLAKLFGITSSDDSLQAASASSASSASASRRRVFADHLRTQVANWFSAQNNTVLVDVLPEECFLIAWNLRLPALLRVAFRILVAERALEDAGAEDAGAEAARRPRTYQSRRTAVFGRELAGLLDDDMETMLDHASEALVHRIATYRVFDDGDVSRDAPLEGLFRDEGSVFHELRAVETVLAAFVEREREVVESSVGGAAEHPPTMAEALSAVRALLQGLASAFASCLPFRTGAVRLTPAALNTESLLKQLALSVPKSVVHANWLAFVYNGLSGAQKRLTAVHWMLLEKRMTDTLSGAQAAYKTSLLVRRANDALRKALTLSPAWSADDPRVRLQRDLYEELLMETQLPLVDPSLGPCPAELLPGYAFRHALHDFVSRRGRRLYDRTVFVPEFEIRMPPPSPHLLLGLSADEFRFLPPWAGGLNDGTGAVFEAPLPTAQLGPIAPGPAYHTGTTEASMSGADSSRCSSREDDDFQSVAGPRSVDAGARSEASSSFVLVRPLDALILGSDGGRSTAPPVSVAAATGPASSAAAAGADVGASASVCSDDLVVVDAADAADAADAGRPVSPADADPQQPGQVAVSDVDFEFEDEDGGSSGEDQEYYDDDDDARSDVTIIPDRDEVEQAMRQAVDK